MKKSEFRSLIREEIKKVLNEGEEDKFKEADPKKVAAIQEELKGDVGSKLYKVFMDFTAVPNSDLRGATPADVGLAIGLIAYNTVVNIQNKNR